MVDLADDRFDITFDPSLVSVDDLLGAIRGLDYEPDIVDAPTARAVVADRVDPVSLPEDLQAMLVEAKRLNKPVLVEFTGPG